MITAFTADVLIVQDGVLAKDSKLVSVFLDLKSMISTIESDSTTDILDIICLAQGCLVLEGLPGNVLVSLAESMHTREPYSLRVHSCFDNIWIPCLLFVELADLAVEQLVLHHSHRGNLQGTILVHHALNGEIGWPHIAIVRIELCLVFYAAVSSFLKAFLSE